MATSMTPVWSLRFLGGAMLGRTIALKPGVNAIGSSGDCDLMLPSGDVQPRHLEVVVGDISITVKRAGSGPAWLNGEAMEQGRRNVAAGDVVRLGQLELQFERSYPTAAHDDSMFADSALAGDTQSLPATHAPAPRARWAVAGVMTATAVALLGMTLWDGRGSSASPVGEGGIGEVEKVLAGYPEVEVVAQPGNRIAVRGYVESRARRQALYKAVERYGRRVEVNVQAADEIVEQARRYVADPGISLDYAGRGRLTVSGHADDDALREKIRRLGEDLHPTVLVTDRVDYRGKPDLQRDANWRAQWDAWQSVLPARLVSITEDVNGNRHIQLANGSRYYEGSVLRSGAELSGIDPTGLTVTGGEPKKPP
jgi:type III secretion system YscD/HrpQ family protein